MKKTLNSVHMRHLLSYVLYDAVRTVNYSVQYKPGGLYACSFALTRNVFCMRFE